MESEQGCGLDDHAELRNASRTHEQRRDPEDKAIKRSEIWRALSGSIANEQLMLEYQGLCGDSARATWAKKFRESNDQVNSEDEQIAHG